MLLSKQVSTNAHTFLIHWLILGLSLLALGGAIGYSITHEHNRIDAMEQDRLVTQAKVVDLNLERQLVALNATLVNIRNDLPYWKAQKNGNAMANLRLQAMSDAMPGVRTLHITDPEGTVFASNRKELIGMNFRDREYFRAARQGLNQDTLYISPPFKTVLGVYALNAVKVVLDAQGKFAGIVSSTLDPEYCTVLLNSVLYTPGMRASLIHGDGKIFVEVPGRNDLAGMDLAKPGSRYTLHVKSGRTANLFTAGKAFSTGDERMSAWRTFRPASLLMDKPMMISVNRDMRGIFAPWRRGVFMQGGLFGVLSLASLFGLYLYQRRRQKYDCLAASYTAELRESEERYRSLVELSPEAVVVHSEGKIVYINKSGVKIFGASNSGEMIGKSIKEFVHPTEWEKVQDRVMQVQEKNEPALPRELVFNRLNGEAINVETAGVPITLSGKIASLTIIHDVTERKRMEGEERRNREEAERLSRETAVIAEIGRVIGSTLHIDEVYDRFAAETQKLILIDSLTVNLYNSQESTMRVAYVSGLNIDGRRQGDPLVLEGSLSETVIRARTSLRIQPSSIDEIVGQFPRLSPIFQAGLRSIMCVPLFYLDEVIGVLHFRSKKQDAYNEKDLRLAERIGVQIAGAIANARLYSDLEAAEQALRVSEDRYRTLVENASDIVFKTNDTGHFVFVNPAGFRITGFTEEDLIGKSFQGFIRSDMREEAMKIFGHQFVKGVKNTYFEYPIMMKNGREVWLGQNTQLIMENGRITGFQAVARDITERKQVEKALEESNRKLETLSITDGLTGIANRRRFDEVLAQEYARHARSGATLSLILLDIDHFKSFNDCYGHVKGDECLRQIAKVISDCAARPADLAARYGGEEFACILPETVSNGAIAIAEKIRRGIIARDIPHKGSDVADCVTASMGVATVQCTTNGSAVDIVSQVDELLYRAKSCGRNRVEFIATQDVGGEIKGQFVHLVWQDSFCCGNKLIDSQHQTLFHTSNNLLEAALSARPSTEISAIITRLLDDVSQHFHDEEIILKTIGFPNITQHVEEHAKLLAKGLKLSKEFEASTLSIGDVFQFLAYDVVMLHMLGADREFFPFTSNVVATSATGFPV